ncbi:MAG: twin-arginine translocase TatA/TatE family subunit [Pirellulales bacterium]
MFGLGTTEMLVILGVAVLLFGKRLPEVGRSLGKGLVEFKKGINGIEDDVSQATYSSPSRTSRPKIDQDEPAAPKFEPPVSEPGEEAA